MHSCDIKGHVGHMRLPLLAYCGQIMLSEAQHDQMMPSSMQSRYTAAETVRSVQESARLSHSQKRTLAKEAENYNNRLAKVSSDRQQVLALLLKVMTQHSCFSCTDSARMLAASCQAAWLSLVSQADALRHGAMCAVQPDRACQAASISQASSLQHAQGDRRMYAGPEDTSRWMDAADAWYALASFVPTDCCA